MKPSPGRQRGICLLLAPDLPGLEVLRLNDVARSGGVGLHTHDSLVLTAVRSGVRRLQLSGPGQGNGDRAGEYLVGPGQCCVVLPGRMHACSWQEQSSADCLCFKPLLLDSLGPVPLLRNLPPVLDDARLHALVCACAAMCAVVCGRSSSVSAPVSAPAPASASVSDSASDSGEQATTLLAAVVRRLMALAATTAQDSSAERELSETAAGGAAASQLAGSLARLEDVDYDGAKPAPPCAELAREAGMAPWEFSRRFASAYGAPPRDYALHLRVQAAKRLLAQGAAPAYVALETGFFDQSHLARRFRALVGLTPGEYAAAYRSSATHDAGKASP